MTKIPARKIMKAVVLLLPLTVAISACATSRVPSYAILPPGKAAITEPEHDEVMAKLIKSLQRSINKTVNVTGSCKIQVENTPVPAAPRRIVELECIGDPRYDEQVREALRHIDDQGLPRFRTMVWSPGWKGILDWSKVIGRNSSATYEPMHDDMPSRLNQDDLVVLTRQDYEAITAGSNESVRSVEAREDADFLDRVDVAIKVVEQKEQPKPTSETAAAATPLAGGQYVLLDVSTSPLSPEQRTPGATVGQSVQVIQRTSGPLYVLLQGPYPDKVSASNAKRQLPEPGYWAQVVSSKDIEGFQAGQPITPAQFN